MKRLNRKRGPEVWQFHWSVTGPDGNRLYHKKIVGTAERYPDENAARRSVVGLVLEINTDGRATNSGSMTVAQLCDHFEQRELAKENTWRSHATKKVMQELLRHSTLRLMLDVYTQAVTPAKHAAQAAVVALVFSSSAGGGSPIAGQATGS